VLREKFISSINAYDLLFTLYATSKYSLQAAAARRYTRRAVACPASHRLIRPLIARPIYTAICIAYAVNSWSLYSYIYIRPFTCPSLLEASNRCQGRSWRANWPKVHFSIYRKRHL